MSVKLTQKEVARIRQAYADFLDSGTGEGAAFIGLLIDPALYLLHYTDLSGDHLLHAAVKRGDMPTLRSLLKAGVDIDRTGDMGCTALHYALSWGQEEIADFLLKKGASQTLRNDFGLLPGEKMSGRVVKSSRE